jgi:branched-chain amino acid transport system substrate-binding protein
VASTPRVLTAAALVASLALSACSGASTTAPASSAAGASDAPASSAAAGAKTIRIGFSAPLSGDQAYYGEGLLDGVKYAAQKFEFTGPLAGSKLEIIPLDDAADPGQAVTVAKRFIADKVDAVIGNFNSGLTMATMPLFNEARMPQVTAGSNPDITTQGFDQIAQVMGNDNNQGKVMADFLKDNLKLGSVAVFDDSQTFGQGVAGVFKEAAAANGTTVVDSVSLNPKSQDFRGSISPVVAKNPDAVYFGGTTTTGGLLCNQLRAAGFEGPFLGPDGIFDPKAIQGCGANVGEMYVSFWFPPADATPELVAFNEDFKKVTGKEQGPYTPEGAIFADFLGKAFEKAGTTDHEAVIKAMHEIELDTFLGKFSIDKNGLRANPDMFIYKAVDGNFVYIP